MTSEGQRTLIRLGAGAAFFIVLIWLMSALRSVTTIVMVAFFLAYILNPLVERLTSWGLGRPLAAFIILFSGLSLFIALLLFIVPVIIEEARKFADVLPVSVGSSRPAHAVGRKVWRWHSPGLGPSNQPDRRER